MAKKLQTKIAGVGCILQPTYRDRKGALKHSTKWSIRLVDGTQRKTGLDDQAAAFQELLKLAGKRAGGEITNIRGTVAELLDLSLEGAKAKGNRSLYDKKSKIEILRKGLGHIRIVEFKTKHATEWLKQRKQIPNKGQKSEAGELSPASKNRYMAELRRAFNLGIEADPPLCAKVPTLPTFEEDNVRQGMLAREDYARMRDAFTVDHARLYFVIAYHLGMRSGEILQLRWDQVDFDRRTIRLESGQTKGKRQRVAPIYGELVGYLEMAKAAASTDCSRVIQLEGEPVLSIRKAWATARRIAKLSIIPHDMRRTAVTNMIEAGVPAAEVMAIIGHRTDSMLRRYMIVGEKTAQRAGAKLEEWVAGLGVEPAAKSRAN